MILKPSDLRKMVAEWLAAGYAVDLDLQSGKVTVAPISTKRGPDPDLVDWSRK